MEEIKKFISRNGFQCCIRKLDYFKNFVTMALVVKVGSTCEEAEQRGTAHLLEHMMMSFYTFQLFADIKFRTKAYTDFNETIYYIKCWNDERTFKICLDIFADIAQGRYLDRKYLERAREDVLEEIRTEKKKTDNSIISMLLQNSLYINNLAIGTEKDIISMKYEDIVSFYRQYYSAEVMSLSIVGDVNVVDDLWKNIDNRFDQIRCSSLRPKKNREFYIPEYLNQIYYKDNVHSAYSRVNIYYKIRKWDICHLDFYKIEILEKVTQDILLEKLNHFLKKQMDKTENDIEFDHMDLDEFYMFYYLRINIGNSSRIYMEKWISKILQYLKRLAEDIENEFVQKLLEQYHRIERDSAQYYEEMGMHQLLLECIDSFTLHRPVLTYEEKCIQYENMSNEIDTREVCAYLKWILESETFVIID